MGTNSFSELKIANFGSRFSDHSVNEGIDSVNTLIEYTSLGECRPAVSRDECPRPNTRVGFLRQAPSPPHLTSPRRLPAGTGRVSGSQSPRKNTRNRLLWSISRLVGHVITQHHSLQHIVIRVQDWTTRRLHSPVTRRPSRPGAKSGRQHSSEATRTRPTKKSTILRRVRHLQDLSQFTQHFASMHPREA
jgi:hypothetical protein